MSKTESAAERVYGEVKELILTSEIPGGELISEGEIADRCEVSRTPVREAFLRLETEGWMRLFPKRGALVVPIREREAADVVDARILLETHAVRSLVDDAHSRTQLLDALRANLSAQRATSPDEADFARLDAEFHQFIVGAGGNDLLAGFFTTLGERHRRMTTVSVHRDAAISGRIVDDHAELINAIERGDAELFATSLISHLAAVHNVRLNRPAGGAR